MNKNNSNVYVLVYRNLNAVKIGKADNVTNRIQQLCHWGKPDFDESYIIPISKEGVYNLECALHLYLKRFKKDMSKNHGYSEFFNLDALDEIPKLLNFYGLKNEKLQTPSLVEEIEVSLRKKTNSIRFKNRINRDVNLINENLNILNNAKRCLYLMKLKGLKCEINKHELIISSPVLSFIKNKNFCFCGVNVLTMSSRKKIYIDINSVTNSFNENGGLFIRQSGFDLSFFYSILVDCYNFLIKGLPNESELPTIKINAENRLEIIF
ncbi:GIY-YIG nuclease family protein [Providencia sp. 2024EL-00732]|uniref:GIY-YIG nuclease family protein n=1 Tax=Providencia sp. 2024EL-00732 TaxID=3374242 RepID=UPI003757AD03